MVKKSGAKETSKDLAVKDVNAVKGGRKAGEGQLEYLKVTMSDVLISGY